MNQTKAAQVASALITAGFPCSVRVDAQGNWFIRSQSTAFDVPVGTVATFVNNQGISGNVAEVEYS
jgi:hypothetical protein